MQRKKAKCDENNSSFKVYKFKGKAFASFPSSPLSDLYQKANKTEETKF